MLWKMTMVQLFKKIQTFFGTLSLLSYSQEITNKPYPKSGISWKLPQYISSSSILKLFYLLYLCLPNGPISGCSTNTLSFLIFPCMWYMSWPHGIPWFYKTSKSWSFPSCRFKHSMEKLCNNKGIHNSIYACTDTITIHFHAQGKS